MNTVDARGLSCPEPVVLTRKAVASGEPSYRVLVDAPAARENVARFARSQGFDVSVAEDCGEWTLDLSRR